MVSCPSGQDDVAWLDAMQRDGGEVRAEAADGEACRDDRDCLSGGDQFVFVLDGFREGAVRGGVPVGPEVDPPVGAPRRPSTGSTSTTSPSRPRTAFRSRAGSFRPTARTRS